MVDRGTLKKELIGDFNRRMLGPGWFRVNLRDLVEPGSMV